jgi:CO/xanthine dehydrogenase FAD-binding subunit
VIPFDFVYRRPETVEEAIGAWRSLPASSLYYSGGTEIVTGARGGSYSAGALIDIKRLPECRQRDSRTVAGARALYFGAGLTLSELAEDSSFPLLAAAARRVADRSVRNRITLGGNVAGRLPFREALLPFLAAGGTAHLAGPAPEGIELRQVPLRELHAKRLLFRPGELLLGLSVEAESAALPFFHDRATSGAAVDYPILALCALARAGRISVAVSGLLDAPAWAEGEAPGTETFAEPRSDARASREYRASLLAQSLSRAREALR